MSTLDRKIAEVKRLIAIHGLDIWDAPSLTRLSTSNPPVDNWAMRIGDPKTNRDFWMNSTQGEYALWCEADRKIAEFIANGEVEADA